MLLLMVAKKHRERSKNSRSALSSPLSSSSQDNVTIDDSKLTESETSNEIPESVLLIQSEDSRLLLNPSTSTSSSEESTPENQLNFSILLLNLLAIIWGTQHSVIKMVVDDCDTAAFSFVRFFLGSVFATLPIIQNTWNRLSIVEAKKEDDDDPALLIRWGVEMGFWMMLGYTFQAVGLQFTTAQRSGFLLYLNVKFVPFFAKALLGRQISLSTWISAFTALCGTFLLFFDGEMSLSSINIGDLWSIAAAAASAMFILRLESASKAIKNGSSLNAASLWVVTIGSLGWCLIESFQYDLSLSTVSNIDSYYFMKGLESIGHKISGIISSHPIEILYLGGVTTALANYIQTKAQRNISAERASLIYALDPVYGAGFAYLLLGEELSRIGIIGAGLITFAAVTNALFDFGGQGSED